MMNKWDSILCILSASVLIASVRTLFSGKAEPLIIGFIILPIIILYLIYLKNKGVKSVLEAQVNAKHISMGIVLILIDMVYNSYTGDPFGPFDYTLLISGFFIILLNTGALRFLKLNEKAIDFTTYFLFLALLIDIILSTGLPFLLNIPKIPPVTFIAKASLIIATFFLNFIKPATNAGDVIDFDGFRTTIGTSCSGVDSMVIYLSVAIAYFIAVKERNLKKICLYTLAGIVAMFLLNIPRIMIIILSGYYYGYEALQFVHYNLGWMMFALAMIVFWYLVIRDE